MSGAVISANTTMKISGGGVINKTSAGSTNIVTTTSSQIAKVILWGSLFQVSGSGSQLDLNMGGAALRSVSAGGTGTMSLHNLREVSSNVEGVQSLEILVPPSSTLSVNFTVSGTASCSVVGSYTILENSP